MKSNHLRYPPPRLSNCLIGFAKALAICVVVGGAFAAVGCLFAYAF